MRILFFILLLFACSNLSFAQGLKTEHVSDIISIKELPKALPLEQAQAIKSPELNILKINIDDWSFFCRLEAKLDKKVGFPIRIRLGEVNEVERKEGKPYSPFLLNQ